MNKHSHHRKLVVQYTTWSQEQRNKIEIEIEGGK